MPGVATRGPDHGRRMAPGRVGGLPKRRCLVSEPRHVAQTAHAVYLAAADTAALLAQRADLIDQPGRIDYPTEIKRLGALADQARQMAERWKP